MREIHSHKDAMKSALELVTAMAEDFRTASARWPAGRQVLSDFLPDSPTPEVQQLAYLVVSVAELAVISVNAQATVATQAGTPQTVSEVLSSLGIAIENGP